MNLFLILYLISNPTFAINLDNEVCAQFSGTSCGNGTEMMFIHMRQGTNSTNRDRCSRLPIICKAPDIDAWISMYHESGGGRRGYRSSYTWSSTKVDKNGVLGDSIGKTYVRCFKKRRQGDWETQVVATCGIADAQPCSHGKVLVDGVCKTPSGVLNTDNSNSVHGYQVADSLYTLAGLHDNSSSQIVADPNQNLAPKGVVEGEKGESTSIANRISSQTSTTGSLGNNQGGASALTGMLESKNAPVLPESNKESLNVGDVSGSETKIQDASSEVATRQQGQSVTNPDVVGGVNQGEAQGLSFTGRSPASLNPDLERVIASSRTNMDSDEYFTKIGIDSNLFRVVTTRLRQEQANWILDQRSRSPQSARGASNTAQ